MGRKFILLLYLICFLLIYTRKCEAQDLSESSNGVGNQYWIDFIPHYQISDKSEFYGDASLRVRDEGERKIITLRPSLKYQVGPILSLHAGIGFFYNIYNDFDNVLEIRPWQGARIGWPDIGPLQFKHFIRLEQRYYPSLDNLLAYRSRYKLSAKMPLNKKVVQEGALFIPIAYEWLWTADDQISIIWASEARLTFGAGYVFDQEWQVEFEYMYWWTKDLPSDEFAGTQQIFRLKFIKSGWVFGE